MEEFHELLIEARKQSSYPLQIDFAHRAHVDRRDYQRWEYGELLPGDESFNRIVTLCGVPKSLCERLRMLLNKARASRAGISIGTAAVLDLNVSALAERIHREVEFELKRMNVKVTPRMRRVCTRRIEMILSSALTDVLKG